MLVSTAAARGGAGDPVEALRQVGVGRVRLAAQRVEDEGVEAVERRPGVVGDRRRRRAGRRSRRCGSRAPRCGRAATRNGRKGIGPPAPSTAKGPSIGAEVEDRRVEAAGGLHEDVGEAGDQQLGGVGVGPDRQAGAAVLHDGAQVVDAVHVVGVRVGEDDAVEQADAGGEELRAQVGGGVDQHAGGAAAGRCARASSEQRLRRFFGFAGSQSPQSPPMRGTPAEEPQPRIVARSRAHQAPRPRWRTAGRSSPR